MHCKYKTILWREHEVIVNIHSEFHSYVHFVTIFKISGTCRCPKELNAFSWDYPPYTIRNNQSSTPWRGIISEFLLQVVKDVCGVCPTHGETSINFEKDNLRKRRSFESFDIILPIGRFQGRLDFAGYRVIPMLEVPGFALIKTPKAKTFLFRAISSSVFESWPYFLIYYAMMTLAGIVYWFLVSTFFLKVLP